MEFRTDHHYLKNNLLFHNIYNTQYNEYIKNNSTDDVLRRAECIIGELSIGINGCKDGSHCFYSNAVPVQNCSHQKLL